MIQEIIILFLVIVIFSLLVAYLSVLLEKVSFTKQVPISSLLESTIKSMYLKGEYDNQKLFIETDKGNFLLGGKRGSLNNKIISISGSLDDLVFEKVSKIEISSLRPFEPSTALIQSRLKIFTKNNYIVIFFGSSEEYFTNFDKSFKNVINLDKVLTFPKLGKRTVRKMFKIWKS